MQINYVLYSDIILALAAQVAKFSLLEVIAGQVAVFKVWAGVAKAVAR